MDVADHDDFSSVSWSEHVHQTTTRPVASPADEEPGHAMEPDRPPGPLGGEKLQCAVGSPLKENDGSKDAFVSYLVITNVRSPLTVPPSPSSPARSPSQR